MLDVNQCDVDGAPMVVITVNEYKRAFGNVHVFDLLVFEPVHPS